VTVRGTVEQAIAEITARHDPDFAAKVLKRAADDAPTTLAERSVLEARADVNCKAQAQWAETRLVRIDEGIKYLRNVKGQTNIGPRKCDRVSCSYSASIWLCNDVSAISGAGFRPVGYANRGRLACCRTRVT
jgi:hypothetical protein